MNELRRLILLMSVTRLSVYSQPSHGRNSAECGIKNKRTFTNILTVPGQCGLSPPVEAGVQQRPTVWCPSPAPWQQQPFPHSQLPALPRPPHPHQVGVGLVAAVLVAAVPAAAGEAVAAVAAQRPLPPVEVQEGHRYSSVIYRIYSPPWTVCRDLCLLREVTELLIVFLGW